MENPPCCPRPDRKPWVVSPDANVTHGKIRVWNHRRHRDFSAVSDELRVPPACDPSFREGAEGRLLRPPIWPTPVPRPPLMDVTPQATGYNNLPAGNHEYRVPSAGCDNYYYDEGKENTPLNSDRRYGTPAPCPWGDTSQNQGRYFRRWSPYTIRPPRRRDNFAAGWNEAPPRCPA